MLRRVYKIIKENRLVSCMIRTAIDEDTIDEFTVCGTFPIINREHFIKTVLDGMKNLKDKQKAYPLDGLTHLIIKVNHKPKVKSISQASNRR